MLVLTTRYPGKTSADPTNYPLAGKARDVTVSGDGTGFPFEADWLNDLFGWQQALLAAAGLTPNNAVENQNASQLLDAIRIIAQQRTVAAYTFGTTSTGTNALFPISLYAQRGGFGLSSNRVTVPAAGKYRITVAGMMQSSSTTNPSYNNLAIDIAPDSLQFLSSQRATTSAGDAFAVSYEALWDIGNPGSQSIGIKNLGGSASFSSVATAYSNLIIERVY